MNIVSEESKSEKATYWWSHLNAFYNRKDKNMETVKRYEGCLESMPLYNMKNGGMMAGIFPDSPRKWLPVVRG